MNCREKEEKEMKIFLVWVKSLQKFENKDLQKLVMEQGDCGMNRLFHVSISQNESQVAMVKMMTDITYDDMVDCLQKARVLTNDARDLSQLQAVFVLQKTPDDCDVLFCGHVSGVPLIKGDRLIEWEFTAQPHDGIQQMQKMTTDLLSASKAGEFESVFYDDVELADVLESRPQVMHWNRCKGQLLLSDLFKGRKHKEVEGDVFEGSLQVVLGENPLKAVNVMVETKWCQEVEKFFDLAPLIAKTFPQGVINTLTPTALLRQWPKVGTVLMGRLTSKESTTAGTSCVEVVKSELYRKPVGDLQGIKRRTKTFKEIATKAFAVKYVWFGAKLWVRWFYKRDRIERVRFQVVNPLVQNGLAQRTLIFRVPREVGQGCVAQVKGIQTVLTTQRGLEWLVYAKRVAKVHLAATSRQVEVSFTVPFSQYYDVDLDTCIHLKHYSLPQGFIYGKVIRYVLEMKESAWQVRITIAATIRQGIVGGESLQEDDWHFEKEECEQEERVGEDEKSSYFEPELACVEDIVHELNISGNAFEQEQFLSESLRNEQLTSVPVEGDDTTKTVAGKKLKQIVTRVNRLLRKCETKIDVQLKQHQQKRSAIQCWVWR